MRIKLFIIITICHIHLFANSKDLEVGDTLFVWADNGLFVRSRPDINSDLITKLNYGERVIVLEIDDRDFEYEILKSTKTKKQTFPKISVIGKFIKVNLSGKVGYVYGGLLSKLKPINKDENLVEYFDRVFGQLKILEDIHSETSDYKFKRIIYNNGTILQKENGNENWWDYLYFVPDISLGEAYLLINKMVSFEENYRRALDEVWDAIEMYPVKFEPNAIVFQSGAFEETKITKQSRYMVIKMSGGN
jgi:hypothetical protein